MNHDLITEIIDTRVRLSDERLRLLAANEALDFEELQMVNPAAAEDYDALTDSLKKIDGIMYRIESIENDFYRYRSNAIANHQVLRDL